MPSTLWVLVAAVAVLWPSRLSGPLDGAPLDQPAEVFLLGVGFPLLLLAGRASLKSRTFRLLVLALMAWKVSTHVLLVQDGWCTRFETPAPLYRDMGLVPHSWDVRADWRSAEPRCSAVTDRPYTFLEEYPVWFYNLPPPNDHWATDADRPPHVELRMTVSGTLRVPDDGRFQVGLGDDVRGRLTVNGQDRSDEIDGVALPRGQHEIVVTMGLQGSRWRFAPEWNGRPVWTAAVATVSPPSSLDPLVRPWGRAVAPALIMALVAVPAAAVISRWPPLPFGAAAVVLTAGFAALGRFSGTAVRLAPALLFLLLAAPRRWHNTRGFLALIAAPFLAWFGVRSASDAGIVTFYTSGDDWWMFQRFAYRIYMQGYWLEGGQPTFWFQPLYRWIAGALHMVFGDASAGELIWDAWCAVAGAYFAFVVARRAAGSRWAAAAAILVLLLFTAGPAWYLFGRGLSEITSMGLLSVAAVLAIHGRHGGGVRWLTGVAATLAFYTRLNNLPVVLSLVAFAWPLRLPVTALWRPGRWVRQYSRPVVAGLLVSVALGLWLFTWRTYYYTGIPSMLHGTQAGALTAWQYTTEGLTPLQNIVGSVLMLVTLNDPPRFDMRAVPVMGGVLAAVLGVAGVPVLRRLPMGPCLVCLAAVAGALVARGSAYPGRFSVHVLPVAVALAVSSVALLWRSRSRGDT